MSSPTKPQGALRSPKNPKNTYNALQDDIEAGKVNENVKVVKFQEEEDQTEKDDTNDQDKDSSSSGTVWKQYDKIEKEQDIDVDIEAGEGEEAVNYPYFDHAAVISVIDRGCWVKTVTGTAGNEPSEDVFPWFANSPEVFIRLLWDLLPSDWRIVSFPKIPKNAYDPDEYLKASQILIKDISEVMLEVAPGTSFRVYLAETKQVVKFTPLPADRSHAAAWVDAIYSAMQLQADEEAVKEAEGDTVEESENLQNLLDLRDKYYEVYPDERPPEYEENDERANNQIVVYDPNRKAGGGTTLGAEEEEEPEDPRNSLRNSTKRASKRLSFTSIYERQKREKPVIDKSNGCCIIS